MYLRSGIFISIAFVVSHSFSHYFSVTHIRIVTTVSWHPTTTVWFIWTTCTSDYHTVCSTVDINAQLITRKYAFIVWIELVTRHICYSNSNDKAQDQGLSSR